MIQIGANKLVTVKVKDRETGKLVPVLGPDGQPEKKIKQDYVERITHLPIGFGFGPDSHRRLVVRLVAPDQIEFKPYKTRRAIRANARDLYRHVLMCVAQSETLRRARERKSKLADQRARRRIDAADRRLRASAKRDSQTEGWVKVIRSL
jgi:hypothetical protein